MTLRAEDYRDVVIEICVGAIGKTRERRRARPIAGQGLDPEMYVECSKAMREQHEVGTLLLVKAKVTSRWGGKCFLYTHHSWPYRVVSAAKARAINRRAKAAR